LVVTNFNSLIGLIVCAMLVVPSIQSFAYILDKSVFCQMSERVLFLGFKVDPLSMKPTGEKYTIKADYLTTHGVIFGATGSGKTGAAIVLIEELLSSGIPVIAFDLKGDLANIALRFPRYRPEDFLEWVGSSSSGDRETLAKEVSELWKKGIRDSGLSEEDVERLFKGSEVLVLTPGSRAGVPVSILGELNLLGQLDTNYNVEVVGEKVRSIASAVLSLVGKKEAPLESNEHVLLSNIIMWAWKNRKELNMNRLISLILNPPFNRIGAINLDTFIGENERKKLAADLNRVVASPGFDVWLSGVALDFNKLLWTNDGKPRAVVVYLAHLEDSMKMFAVTMILQALYGWMYTLGGTDKPRVLLYFDEVYGFIPPHPRNPPSKRLLMLLVKQARAFGLGIILATQNPVDIDYKVLTNAGMWMIGRLQTENDIKRVVEGLRQVSVGSNSTSYIKNIISRLPQRAFVVNNVHTKTVDVFITRWAMTYMHGPMTLNDIEKLSGRIREVGSIGQEVTEEFFETPPEIYAGFSQVFVEPTIEPAEGGVPYYKPILAGLAVVKVSRSRPPLSFSAEVSSAMINLGNRPVEFTDGWKGPDPKLLLKQSSGKWRQEFVFENLPSSFSKKTSYDRVLNAFMTFVRERATTTILHASKLGLYSKYGESEVEFLKRVHEEYEKLLKSRIEKIDEKYKNRTETLYERIRKKEEILRKYRTELENLTAELGVRSLSTVLSITRPRSLLSRTVKLQSLKRRIDSKKLQIAHIESEIEKLKSEINDLRVLKEKEIEEEKRKLKSYMEVKKVTVRPSNREVRVTFLGFIWLPYLRISGRDLPLFKESM